jgi:predicted ATP-grasp superfamily ATP-dependent carboligase
LLADLAEKVVAAGKRLIGPSPDAIRLTSDKRRLAEHWRRHGVPTPAILDGDPTTFPVVVKPVDGCGSTATFLANDRRQFDEAMAEAAAEGFPRERMIVQPYALGDAFSVTIIDGEPLLPMFQDIDPFNGFAYSGGGSVICAGICEMLETTAMQATSCVPGLRGYYGVDLVYDEDHMGEPPYCRAIEINPRLTTSYVGLRSCAIDNLARRVLHRQKSPIEYRELRSMRFTATGLVGLQDRDGTWTTV